MKAIETEYNGYRFRSRLEARWAVFFDQAGIRYEYEFEGVELDGEGYLPDFWLPNLKMWVEIKPTIEASIVEESKLLKFYNALEKSEDRAAFFVFAGSPYLSSERFSYNVLYFTGHPERQLVSYDAYWSHCPMCDRVDVMGVSKLGEKWGILCSYCDTVDRSWPRESESVYFHKGWVCTTEPNLLWRSPRLTDAYRESRGARFEFGETPSRPQINTVDYENLPF